MRNKLIFCSIACLMLTGCGGWNKFVAHIESYTTVCVNETHVMYVQFPTGAAPLYNQDGTLVRCN